MYFDQKSKQVLKSVLPSSKSHPNVQILPWEKLGRVGVIKSWCEEISKSFKFNAGIDEWNLVGVAVTIIHDDIDDCKNILQRVACDVGFTLQCVSSLNINKNYASIQDTGSYLKPTIVYLEPGKWLEELDDPSDEFVTIQENICELVKSFKPACPVIYVLSIPDFTELSLKFRKVGLFDRRFNVVKPSLEEMAAEFIEMIGCNLCDQDITTNLGKVGKLLDLEFDDKRRQGLIALTLKRIGKKENRKINFSDLVNLALKGSAEYDAYPQKKPSILKQIAIHEAGHALISIVDSDGQNIPEYAGLIESNHYSGVVSDSFSYHYQLNGKRSYADVRHQVRILLAGRAAEHILLGIENISVASAKDDLKRATEISYDMFAHRGVAIRTDSFEDASSNLAVFIDKNSQSNLSRVESLTRQYLKDQYTIVYESLNKNRELLDLITENLLEKKMLNQEDFYSLISGKIVKQNVNKEKSLKQQVRK